uniref:Uncharacterized protein n=1 Tax=Megaselia scalaris TaxID=36166 RepID=T1GFK9_MEGSC
MLLVNIIYVPSNILMGSKETLSLAKTVSEQNFKGPKPVFRLSATVIRNTINNWVFEAHNRYWLWLDNCRWAKLIVPHINKEIPNMSFSDLVLMRQEVDYNNSDGSPNT